MEMEIVYLYGRGKVKSPWSVPLWVNLGHGDVSIDKFFGCYNIGHCLLYPYRICSTAEVKYYAVEQLI